MCTQWRRSYPDSFDAPFNRVRRNTLRVITSRAINDALARASAPSQNTVLSILAMEYGAAQPISLNAPWIGARENLSRLRCTHLGRIRAEHPAFAVVYQYADDAVRATFGAGKL